MQEDVSPPALVFWTVVLILIVGSGVTVTSPRLFNAGSTDDLRQALSYLTHKYPRAPLLGLGFSVGGNILTRYLSEEGEASRLSSVLTISNVGLSSFYVFAA
jgi:predicted alpha/beta-fold hydrolase